MGLAKAYDAWQRIGAFFGALGTIAAGVVLYLGPEDIATELPAHREIGVAVGAFGVVFLLAVVLGSKSGIGRRCRSLTLAGICAAVVFLAGRTSLAAADGALRLTKNGVATTATVTEATFVWQKNHTSPRARILYDGHRGTLRLQRRRGDTLPVVYVEDDPSVVVHGRPGESFHDYASRLAGSPLWFYGSAALTLFCVIAMLFCLKGFLLGSPPDAD